MKHPLRGRTFKTNVTTFLKALEDPEMLRMDSDLKADGYKRSQDVRCRILANGNVALALSWSKQFKVRGCIPTKCVVRMQIRMPIAMSLS